MQAAKTPRERLAELAAGPDGSIDLALGALLLAAEAYPALDIDFYLGRLDAIAAQAAAALSAAGAPTERALELLRFLFHDQGFVGNRKDYYDRRNSFLNEVLDRRTGIPITLSVLHIEVGARVGLLLEGVGFPGHFLVKLVDEPALILDPFFGRVLDETDCEERLTALFGERARFSREQLRPARRKEILVRMLNNLKQIYLRAREFESALSCSERILLLAPDAARELRDRGLLYAQLECYRAAEVDLERFLEIAPEDESAEAVRKRLFALRRQAPRLH